MKREDDCEAVGGGPSTRQNQSYLQCCLDGLERPEHFCFGVQKGVLASTSSSILERLLHLPEAGGKTSVPSIYYTHPTTTRKHHDR